MRLSDFKGEKVMINFWASWCGPCRSEMPDMEKFYHDKDVKILAVNVTDTERSLSHVTDFIDEISSTFTFLLDEYSDVSKLFIIKTLHTKFLLYSCVFINYY